MITEESVVRLKCPLCGRQGDALWKDGALGTPRQLESLSAGFLSIDTGTSEGPRILCQSCRVSPSETAERQTDVQ